MSEMLSTYLRDHHAGATAGAELAGRAARSNADGPFGKELATIAAEIAEDRETLEEIMAELEVSPDRLKDGGAWIAEKLGRLKPNNRLFGYSPLSRVIELEGLVLGVTGKQALWEALRACEIDGLAEFDFEQLIARAQSQRQRLETMRRDAATEAFA